MLTTRETPVCLPSGWSSPGGSLVSGSLGNPAGDVGFNADKRYEGTR